MDTRTSDQIAEELAALRRVAVLVARGAPPEEVFAAVTAETGRLLGTNLTIMARFDPDETITYVARWSTADRNWDDDLHRPLGGANVSTLVFKTGQPARIDDFSQASGWTADIVRKWHIRSSVGAPVFVEGRLWGLVSVSSTKEEAFPADTETRLAGFTELAGTAIANAEAHSALAASRARIVVAADEGRRRIERDLHDGAQQRLITLALRLRELQATASAETGDMVKQLDGVSGGLDAALEELREIARGIHPAVLAKGGLDPALKALARRSPVPVTLDVQVADRLPSQVEIAAYYVVSEALANTAKHARAATARVKVSAEAGPLRVTVRDDGRGGAELGPGSGLVGLKDRVEALGGRITLDSPPGAGTVLEVSIPVGPSRQSVNSVLAPRDENG